MITILLGVAFVAALAAAGVLWARWRRTRQEAMDLRGSLVRTRTAHAAEIDSLKQRIDRLARWERVADADETAAAMLRQARVDADAILAEAAAQHERAIQEAEQHKLAAAQEAERIRAEGAELSRTAGASASSIIASASTRADEIVAEARARAEEIAGDALRALNEARELERTVKALENTIDGYGDRYIVPGYTLLDELAEGFGHTEAGQQLKLMRDQVRNAVRWGRAATCEYVEANRRETAIRFVVDAFNGKVDSILAKVKHDNAGTLQQQVHDAFTLVNHNGQAFRNARITQEYLDLRLAELRWAAVVHELQQQEREEQRRIRDQMREEEKARKEFERTMKDAAREEEMLRKAMEKAQQQLERANDEQRARYEAQLSELALKLREAEERNQRAISMAQQTRQGHVYVISNVGSFGEHVYKIGLTRRLDPHERIRELGDSSVPFSFDVHALIFAEDAPALETRLHRHFMLAQVNKVNHRKEFFRANLAEIRSEIESLGLDAQWTMAAEAREYRETQAIEAAIRDNPQLREAWIRRQLLLEALPEDSEEAGGNGGTGPAIETTLGDLVAPAPPAGVTSSPAA